MLPGILIGGAAVGLAIAKGGGEESPVVPPQTPQQPVARPSTPIAAQLAAVNGTGPLMTGSGTVTNKATGDAGSPGSPKLGMGSTGTIPNPYLTDGGGNWKKAASVVADQGIKQMEDAVRDQYNKLSLQARKAGAEALNKALEPNSPHLTGEENFDEAGKKTGAVIGGAVGGAACAAYPATAAAAPLCAWVGSIAGAYLGEHAGKWAKDAWGSVKSWSTNAYHKAKDALKKIIPFW